MRIAVVAPSSRFRSDAELDEVVARVTAVAAERHPAAEIVFHPQCRLRSGHFAGTDEERAGALVEVADDPSFDAVWFARGGYGSNRIAERAVAAMGPAARDKAWLGYSDAGFLLAALYRAGFAHVAHGPMPKDVLAGEAAVRRALDWLVERSSRSLEPGLEPGQAHAAFNLTVLSHLVGTPLEPDLSGHVLLLEEVAEHLYRIDRALFHILSVPLGRSLAGIRLGRVSDVPDNDPEFGASAEEIVHDWCDRMGVPYLGEADIGHDPANKLVPFGPLRT